MPTRQSLRHRTAEPGAQGGQHQRERPSSDAGISNRIEQTHHQVEPVCRDQGTVAAMEMSRECLLCRKMSTRCLPTTEKTTQIIGCFCRGWGTAGARRAGNPSTTEEGTSPVSAKSPPQECASGLKEKGVGGQGTVREIYPSPTNKTGSSFPRLPLLF